MIGTSNGSGPGRVEVAQTLALALLLVVVVILTYREAPRNQFHFDDTYNIVDHGPVRMERFSVEALMAAFMNPRLEYRNVPSLTFAIDWWRGGGEPRAFLQTNILLHALTALAVFVFAQQVLRRITPDDPGILPLAAFLVALVWAVHPVNSQAVNLIVQRMAILATLFVLLSLSCYLAGRGAGSWRAVAWLVGAGLFAALGALSKQNAWILPVLVVAAEYGIVRHRQPMLRNRADSLLLALPFVAAAMVLMDLVSGSGPISNNYLSGYDIRSFSMEERLLTQPRVVFFYLSLVLWPLPGRFSLEHDFVVSTSLLSPPTTLLSMLALAAFVVAAMALFVRPGTRAIGFLLLWPVMTLAIESSFIPLEMVFEHRMYMPMVGLAMLVGAGFVAMQPSRPTVVAGVVAAVLAVTLGLATSTAMRTTLWQEPLTLNEDALRKAPGSARAWGNVGMHRYLGGDRDGAIAALEKAIELSGGREKKALEHLGVIYLDLGDLDRAETLLGRAYRLQWEDPEPSILNHMGEVALARKRYAGAVEYFGRAIGIAPWKSAYYWNIALAYEGLANCRRALESWHQYLDLETDPDSRGQVEKHIAENYGRAQGGC
jgi:hypothetical protein